MREGSEGRFNSSLNPQVCNHRVMPKHKTPKLPKKHTPDQAAHKEAKRLKQQNKEGFSHAASPLVREVTQER
jgi:hypothetical protein